MGFAIVAHALYFEKMSRRFEVAGAKGIVYCRALFQSAAVVVRCKHSVNP